MEEANKTAAQTFDSGSNVGRPESGGGEPGRYEKHSLHKGEVDTSAPFESVKEAVSRFGGIGFWKPHTHKSSEASENGIEVVDVAKVEEQATQLEKDLILKERETLEVLKELEATKTTVEELKLKLQKEASEVNAALNPNSDDKNVHHHITEEEKEKEESEVQNSTVDGLSLCPSSTPGFILMELKQAKLYLTRATNDLADIRATVKTFNKKIERERLSLEKTRQRLSSKFSKFSSLEEEINQTKQKLQQNPIDISMELQRLTSEMENFKKIGEAAKSEVSRSLSEIEQMKTRIKTTEIRLIAARKMKEAAKASEALALSEMKALSHSEKQKPSCGITLSLEEYSSLISKAREAEEASKKRVTEAMFKVDEANVSTTEILKRVEEATEEVKTSKRALEEALNSVEAANSGKLAVEEALRKWRSENGCQKRRSVQNSTKFKNSYPSHLRSNSRLFDVNGMNLASDVSVPVLRPTLSIGQILSRKLLLNEEYSEKSSMKRIVSLGQMLNKHKDVRESGHKQLPAKRKKFGFAPISFLVGKPSKKKKKQSAASSRLSCAQISN